MAERLLTRLWHLLSSLPLAIVCMGFLMLLVVLCTLAQGGMGTMGAVNKFMRGIFVWWESPSGSLRIPVLPGGALVGAVLTVNLALATIRRLDLSWRKAGLWITHMGLILLVAGEFITGAYQVERILTFNEGQTVNVLESQTKVELALADASDPAVDDVFAVPESLLAKGGTVALPGSSVTLRIKAFHRHSQLARLGEGEKTLATTGVGTGVKATGLPAPPQLEQAMASLFVEVLAGGQSLGTFLASQGLGAPQGFQAAGKTWTIQLRREREYLPYALTLKEARHDVYAGTDIPRNFSSKVRLVNAASGENREALISMNQPLRYGGKAFYQFQMGGPEGDHQSVLQVVENPGWLLPYVSCTLVALGLVIHFLIMLGKFLARKEA